MTSCFSFCTTVPSLDYYQRKHMLQFRNDLVPLRKISLRIRPVWSESSLSAWRKLGSLATHWTHSKDFDQTGRMPRLIWVFAGCTSHFVGFVVRWLIPYMHPLRKHAYSNILKILPPKIQNFQIKKSYIFHISAQNIDCGYSLEPPRRGDSNEHPKSMFWAEIRKIMYTPVNPSFTI